MYQLNLDRRQQPRS